MSTIQRHAAARRAADRTRLSARVPAHVQQRLEAAADLTGATVNQFMVQAALEKAEALLERERVTMLSARDAERLLELLDHPPPPNDKLRRALEKYRKASRGDPSRPFEWLARSREL